MTYDEMNRFILNYIVNDNTGRAIMLSGGWGSGKSYYIKEIMKPFLEEKKNGEHKCVIISLYGISNISEISKLIYIELRTIKKPSSTETASTAKVVGKIFGKTVLNGIISKIGFDIGRINDDDLNDIYESINLEGKLIVFEDIERTNIRITELLGYINNLCEIDGVKVLLVANEQELLQYNTEKIETKENDKINSSYKKVYSENALKYIKAKEKSISDTLIFSANSNEAVASIIDSFKNEDLSIFRNDPSILKKVLNYREFKVSCQKACDIYNYIKTNNITVDKKFKKCIYIGMVNYLQKRINNRDLNFKYGTSLDSDLSDDKYYPLMRFCYDYINYHTINQESIIQTIEEYNDYLVYIDKESSDDDDLRVLYKYKISTDSELNKVIVNIYNRLNDITDISLYHYDYIIYYLIKLKYDVHLENDRIDEVIERIISNLKGRGSKFDKNHFLVSIANEINDTEGSQKLKEIMSRVFDSLDYKPDYIDMLDNLNYDDIIDRLSDEDISQYNPDKMIEQLQLDRIIENISGITSKTLDNLKIILFSIDYSKLSDKSLSSIIQFKDEISQMLQKEDTDFDCIKIYGLKHMCSEIDRMTCN